jgi:phosphatidylserine decarboxylase
VSVDELIAVGMNHIECKYLSSFYYFIITMKTLLFQESMDIVLVLLFLLFLSREHTNAFIFFLLTLFSLIFMYRVPYVKRQDFPQHVISSPCYGKVLKIEETDKTMIVKIYLNILDVHVQWFPMSGIVRTIQYKDGVFNLAHILEKSEYNEKVTTVVQNHFGTVRVDQIAGQLFRRIENWSEPGTYVKRGQPLGMIKLSSRVDIHIPIRKARLLVSEGDYVYGKKTPIAEWTSL